MSGGSTVAILPECEVINQAFTFGPTFSEADWVVLSTAAHFATDHIVP